MGCDNSKSTEIADNCSEPELVEGGFKEFQIDTIGSTWPLVSKDLVQNGTNVFIRIFQEEPEVKTMFPAFREKKLDFLERTPAMKEHARLFMKVIEEVVDNIDTIPNNSDVNDKLASLGYTHASFDGFDTHYFRVFQKSLIGVWEVAIGEEFIQEVRDCWKAVFDYIFKQMLRGCEVYTHERKNGHSGHSM